MMILRNLAAALLCLGVAAAQEPVAGKAAPAAVAVVQAAKPYTVVAAYPLTTCVASGEELDADAVTFEAGGRTFKTCCDKCKAKVEKDPAPFAAKLDAAIVASQLPGYPLTTCPISKKPLGSMGDPIQHVFDGTLVQLCCKGCNKKAIAAAPAMAELVRDAAYAAQGKTYALKTCAVSDEKLGADAVDVMYGMRLVRLCCKDCIGELQKNPAAAMAKLDAAGQIKSDADDAKPAEPKKVAGEAKDLVPAAAIELTALKGKSGEGCGEACVSAVTGSCCSAGAASKPKATPKASECCDTATATPKAPAAPCCDTTAPKAPVAAPVAPKKID